MTNPRLCYQTVEFGKTDIHLCTLRDKQEFHDPDGVAEGLGISSALWPLFGVIWPSSLVLAHYLAERDIDEARILEVGCGIGLSSLLLNKLQANITATDYHPEAEKFLLRNTLLNGDRDIPFERVDWVDTQDKLGQFDFIIGSDLLYEDQHAQLLGNFIQNHANPSCEVMVVDPGRGRKNKLKNQMHEHGFSSEQFKPAHTDYLDDQFKGHLLQFQR